MSPWCRDEGSWARSNSRAVTTMAGGVRRALLCGLVLGCAALAGCAPSEGGEGQEAPGWDEPGWMAQARQQEEEHQNAVISCFAEYGVEAVPGIGGGVLFSSSGDGELPPGTDEILETASADCYERFPMPEYLATEYDDTAYQRTLDVRECITAHGYEVSEPPSLEVWKESSSGGTPWNPFDELTGDPSGHGISESDFGELTRECPQPGPGLSVMAPTGDA